MVVYIDLLIISTLIVNYAFIKTIAIVFHENIRVIRLIISLLTSAISLLLYLLPYRAYFSIRYLIGIIIGFIAFDNKNIKIRIIEISIFYLLTMSFIGTLFVFNVNNILLMIISVFYVVGLYLIQTYHPNQNIYNVNIGNNRLLGYIDTGNIAMYKSLPIVFINEKYKSQEYILDGITEIDTINNKSINEIYIGPLLQINKKYYKVCYIFINKVFNNCEVLLPYNIFHSSHIASK